MHFQGVRGIFKGCEGEKIMFFSPNFGYFLAIFLPVGYRMATRFQKSGYTEPPGPGNPAPVLHHLAACLPRELCF